LGLVEHFLELHWRHIPDRGMQPLVIINLLNEVGKPILDIGHGSIFPEVDLLGFQGFEKTLSRRVVVGISFAGHADAEAMLMEDLHVVARCILNPPIGVMNDSCRGLALDQSHPEGLQAQGRVDSPGKRISHHPAGKEIQQDGKIDKATQDTDVGQIGHPDLIGSHDPQVGHEVGIDPMGMAAVGGANPTAPGFFR
jgi:hypothetical protein